MCSRDLKAIVFPESVCNSHVSKSGTVVVRSELLRPFRMEKMDAGSFGDVGVLSLVCLWQKRRSSRTETSCSVLKRCEV